MPLKSKAQERFLFSQKPGMAKEFASKTPDISSLPQKAGGLAQAIQAQGMKGMMGK